MKPQVTNIIYIYIYTHTQSAMKQQGLDVSVSGISALIQNPTSSTPSPSSISSSANQSDQAGIIAGSFFGTLLALGGLAGGAWFAFHWRQRHRVSASKSVESNVGIVVNDSVKNFEAHESKNEDEDDDDEEVIYMCVCMHVCVV